MLFVVPLVLFLTGYNFYTMRAMNERVAESNRSAVYLYESSWRRTSRISTYSSPTSWWATPIFKGCTVKWSPWKRTFAPNKSWTAIRS